MAAIASGEPPQYEFRISGHLDLRWESWFDGLALTHEVDDTTTLRGRVVDQSALHGVLGRLRDLGVTLISMRAVGDVGDAAEPDDAGLRDGDGTR